MQDGPAADEEIGLELDNFLEVTCLDGEGLEPGFSDF